LEESGESDPGATVADAISRAGEENGESPMTGLKMLVAAALIMRHE
jgi:hypothetical protein